MDMRAQEVTERDLDIAYLVEELQEEDGLETFWPRSKVLEEALFGELRDDSEECDPTMRRDPARRLPILEEELKRREEPQDSPLWEEFHRLKEARLLKCMMAIRDMLHLTRSRIALLEWGLADYEEWLATVRQELAENWAEGEGGSS